MAKRGFEIPPFFSKRGARGSIGKAGHAADRSCEKKYAFETRAVCRITGVFEV